MEKNPVTKWIIIGVIIAIIGALGTGIFSAMNDLIIKLDWCAQDDPACFLKVYGILFSTLIVIGLLMDFAIRNKIFFKIVSYFDNPKSKNLHLYSGSLIGNIYTLKFVSKEWRYFFRKSDAFINIDSLVGVIEPSPEWERLERRNPKEIYPFETKRFVLYEINFLEVDPKRNQFWILARQSQRFRFPPGKYAFMIKLNANIYGNFKIRNKFLGKAPFKTVHQLAHVIVDYQGEKNISAKTVERQEYEKHDWVKKFDWEEWEKKRKKDNP